MSSELPRPLPKASLTLLYFVSIAMLVQMWSRWVLQPEVDLSQSSIEHTSELKPHTKKSAKKNSWSVTVAKKFDWAPRDVTQFMPRLFRPNTEPEETPMEVEDIDDEALLSELQMWENSPVEVESDLLEIEEISVKVVEDQPKPTVIKQSKEPKKNTEKLIALNKNQTHSKSKNQKNRKSTIQNETSETQVPKKVKRPKRRRKGGITLYSVENPKALDYFFKKLTLAKNKQSKVRVIHYGDSLIAGDYVTQTARRLLQKKFGDAGPGFFLAGKGSNWYRRQWVSLKTYGRWKRYKITKPSIKDKSYGLGGVTFSSSSSGAWVKATPSAKKGMGSRASIFEVYYLAHPKGGTFEVSFDDQTVTVDSKAEVTMPRKIRLKADKEGKHTGMVKVIEGHTRLFGLVLERKRTGVIYDSIGLEGVRAKQLLKHNYTHWNTQLRMRNPHLFVIHYGTNESEFADMNMSAYESSLVKVIKRFRKSLPKASCLLVSPMDRAYKDEDTGRIRSRMIVKKIVDSQRKVALQQRCAFWSSYDAMGGWGSMARWYRAKPKLAGGDLTHPTRLGANRVGAMFFAALMEAYQNQ